ncbi:unnamed protein product [Lepidochelys kempii]
MAAKSPDRERKTLQTTARQDSTGNSEATQWHQQRNGSQDEQTELPPRSATGGLHSLLEDTVSPVFSATVIINVTVILSGSAYLCFLKYICSGCCKSTQVEPVIRLDPSRSEEQV